MMGTRATDLPDRGSPLASLRITSTVALELPSAGTVVLLATMSESATTGTIGGGEPKVTCTSSPTSGRPSVMSVARYWTTSEVVSVTCEGRLAGRVGRDSRQVGLITDEPLNAVNATMMPGTALALWSSSVTVIVDAVVPSAGTLVGLACTDD